jgi:hypothetical protein
LLQINLFSPSFIHFHAIFIQLSQKVIINEQNVSHKDIHKSSLVKIIPQPLLKGNDRPSRPRKHSQIPKRYRSHQSHRTDSDLDQEFDNNFCLLLCLD